MRGRSLVLAAGLLLAGCGGTPPAAAPRPSAAEPTSSSSPPSPSPMSPSPTSLVPSDLSVPPFPTAPVTGGDISWPNCPKGMGIPQKRSEGAPMPLRSARFVVLGLTNGPGFVANPCLASQLAWAQRRHLLVAAYSITSWPDRGTRAAYADDGPFSPRTRLGRLRNAGYQEARFNIATMHRVGLQTPAVWVDVEPVRYFDWPADLAGNTAVVTGAIRGYAEAGYRVGLYSVPSLWQQVVGDLRLRLPEWRAVGEADRTTALRACRKAASFGGGGAVLAQWVDGRRDRDTTCPAATRVLDAWFHRS